MGGVSIKWYGTVRGFFVPNFVVVVLGVFTRTNVLKRRTRLGNAFPGSRFPGARESREWHLEIPDSREWKYRSGNAFPIPGLSAAKIWPITCDISKTVQDTMQLCMFRYWEVVYGLSIGTNTSDLEWPWTALWPIFTVLQWVFAKNGRSWILARQTSEVRPTLCVTEM